MNNKWITLKSFIPQVRLIGVAFEHCFDVTLGGFEQIINNDFTQLEAECLDALIIFPGSQTNLE